MQCPKRNFNYLPMTCETEKGSKRETHVVVGCMIKCKMHVNHFKCIIAML